MVAFPPPNPELPQRRGLIHMRELAVRASGPPTAARAGADGSILRTAPHRVPLQIVAAPVLLPAPLVDVYPIVIFHVATVRYSMKRPHARLEAVAVARSRGTKACDSQSGRTGYWSYTCRIVCKVLYLTDLRLLGTDTTVPDEASHGLPHSGGRQYGVNIPRLRR